MKTVIPVEPQKVKDKRREELEQQIRDYLARGGRVTILPSQDKKK